MAAQAPKESDLQGVSLKQVETKEGGSSVDPTVLKLYRETYEKFGGDKAQICGALGLDASANDKYFASVEAFTAKFLAAK